MLKKTWLIPVALGLGVTSFVGCNKLLECGPGTVEKDGLCVAGDEAVTGGQCGPGTVFDWTSGVCRNADLVGDGGTVGVCGPNTVVEYSDGGVPYCVGTGDGGGCLGDRACPAPTGSKITLCGKIFDVEDTSKVEEDAILDGDQFKIKVYIYDALAFANAPPGMPPAPIGEGDVDRCGRFVAQDITTPFTGFVAVATEDHPDRVGVDDYILTGIATRVENGQTLRGLRAFVTRRATEAMWTASANLPGGQTLLSKGIYLPVFINTMEAPLSPFPGAPTAGVTITFSNGMTNTANDYYFADMMPLNRTTIDPAASVTGPNGTGVYVLGDLVEYSGSGGNLPAGCNWPKTLAKSVPGVVFVQERESECL